MKLLWVVLTTLLLAGCAVVPAPYPYASPGVSVGVGVGVPVPVPVYRGGHYHRGHYGPRHPYYHGRGYGHRW